jgi:hypothetical protein
MLKVKYTSHVHDSLGLMSCTLMQENLHRFTYNNT